MSRLDKDPYLRSLNSLLNQKHVRQEAIDICMEYAQKLRSSSLPVVFDRDHLAHLLGLRVAELTYLAMDQDNHYSSFRIPKRCGGYREIDSPSVVLKDVQRWILREILERMKVSEWAFGFVSGLSVVDNARLHLGKQCVINIDLKDFFSSISWNAVFRVFSYYGYSGEVAFYLSKLCTFRGLLPQGSPASPRLSNIVFLKADKRLSVLADRYNATYSRYADDITFSGAGNLQNIIPVAEKILLDEGFSVNHNKIRIARNNQRQEVTGLIVNEGDVRIPKKYKRAFFQEVYYCTKFGVSNHMERRGIKKMFYKEHLYGQAYYLLSIEPETGRRALKALDKVDWSY